MKIISILALIIGATLIGYGIGLNQSKNSSTTPLTIERCENKSNIKLEYGTQLKKSISRDDFWQMNEKSQFNITNGKHQSKKAISIKWFFSYFESGTYLEILPCIGDPYRISNQHFLENPDRYYIIRNSRGKLKLIDTNNDKQNHILKNIHLFRMHHD